MIATALGFMFKIVMIAALATCAAVLTLVGLFSVLASLFG